jgi:hypothetical protein
MTLNHCSNMRCFILAAALISGLGHITHASAQELRSYLIDLNTGKATELGTLGGDFSIPGASMMPGRW